MVFKHITHIEHPVTRRAARAVTRGHLIFLKLLALKALVFHVAGLKAVVTGSSFLMGLFALIPGFDLVEASGSPVDYSISNTTYPLSSEPGDTVVFMYYYQNQSSPYVAAEDVAITATLPQGLTYDSASVSPTSNSNGTITRNLSNSSNRYGMILLRATVDQGAYGILTNTVNITAANSDPIVANNTASASILINDGIIPGGADLRLIKTVNYVTGDVNMQIVYVLVYSNIGTGTASGTVLYDMIPSEVYVLQASQAPSITSGNIYGWNLGNLGTGASGSIIITGSLYPLLPSGHVITNNAIIDSIITEGNSVNNSAQATTTVLGGQASVYAHVFSSDSEFCVGENIQYTIDFGNDGLANASNVRVESTLPSQVTYASSSLQPTYNNGNVRKRQLTNPLAPGSNNFITITATANAVNLGLAHSISIYSNDILVASDSFDIDILPASLCATSSNPGGESSSVSSPSTPVSTPTPIKVSTGSTGVVPPSQNTTGFIAKTGTILTGATGAWVNPIVQPKLVTPTPEPVQKPVEQAAPSKALAKPKLTPSDKPVLVEKPKLVIAPSQDIAHIVEPLNQPVELCESAMAQDVYDYAKDIGLTSVKYFADAGMCDFVPRKYFAKMLVEYVLNLAIPEPRLNKQCQFTDIGGESNELQFYMKLVCDFGLMGVDEKGNTILEFRPNDYMTRAEVAKALSSLLFGDQYNKALGNVTIPWYQGHLQALYDAYIMKNIETPDEYLLKTHIIMMFQRIHLGNVAWNTKYIRLKANGQ